MSVKRNKTTGVKSTECDKCGISMISVPGKRHRRCGGAPGAAIRPKHSIGTGARGYWR